MKLPDSALQLLMRRTGAFHLMFPPNTQASNLMAAPPDSQFYQAQIILGQPDPDAVLQHVGVRWVHLSSAGYERYDRQEFRAAMQERGVIVTNSSSVYDEPCSEHAMAMILATCRRLPEALDRQRSDHGWPALEIRERCRLLVGQTVLLLGFGAIGQRVAALLKPFGARVIAIRRKVTGDEGIEAHPAGEIDRHLPDADHVLDILPGGRETTGFMSARRFQMMKQTAMFYNIGRGATVDQDGLLEALKSHRIAGAYLDVMTPEPLAPEHELWNLPNCWITPHAAGGHEDEHVRLVEHFLQNLTCYQEGCQMKDRVM